MTTRFLFTTVFSALLLGAAPAVAQDAEELVEEAEIKPTFVYDAKFDDDLHIDQPIVMRGLTPTKTFSFTLPASWELVDDVELHLDVIHSEKLIPEKSQISILVNNRPVLTERSLDFASRPAGKLVVNVPRDLVLPWNEVKMLVTQHYGSECEDPFDYSLWTRVTPESFVRYEYERKDFTPTLAQLPAPFYDDFGLGPVSMNLVMSEPVADATIAALGTLGLSYGRRADHRGVDVHTPIRSLRQARHHALLVGTYDSNPEIGQLIGGPSGVKGSDGLVAVARNPHDPTLGVLIVTGTTEDGVVKAAKAIGTDFEPGYWKDKSAQVIRDNPKGVSQLKREPLPAPPAKGFTLEDLGMPDKTVTGFFPDTVSVPLMLEGNAKIRAGEASMKLDYGYGPGLDRSMSNVEVILDGVVLATASLANPNGANETLRVDIPGPVLRPTTTFQVRFHLFPDNFERCQNSRDSDETLTATVYNTTQFSIVRDRFADMPDLALLRHNLWPYSLEDGGGEVTLMTGDNPSLQDAAAAFRMAANLGRSSSTMSPEFETVSASVLNDGIEFPSSHVIMLRSDGKHTGYNSIVNDLTVIEGEGSSGGYGGVGDVGRIEQLQNPQNPDASIMVLSAKSRSDLIELVDRVGDAGQVSKLDKAVVNVPSDRAAPVTQAYPSGQHRLVGEKPISTRVTQALSSYWPFFGLLLLGAALLFTLVVSLWARRNGAHL